MIQITYEGIDKAFETNASSQDLFTACKKEKFPVPFGCRIGTCGICKIKVLEGLEFFSRKTKDEKQFTGGPDERLACIAVVKGSVKFVRLKK